MAKRFEFRFIDAGVPDGLLAAEHLIALVQGLKELATKLSRTETHAETLGRPNSHTKQIATLQIGLAAGSTTLIAQRAQLDEALEFDIEEEAGFDLKLQESITGIAVNHRPEWMTDTQADTAENLRKTFARVSPTLEFFVDGDKIQSFNTRETISSVWEQTVLSAEEPIVFYGELRAANLNSKQLHVRDDIGHAVQLPEIENPKLFRHLLGEYVAVTGEALRDQSGRITKIVNAEIQPLDAFPTGTSKPPVRSAGEIIKGSEPQAAFVPFDFTADESDAFLEAMGLT